MTPRWPSEPQAVFRFRLAGLFWPVSGPSKISAKPLVAAHPKGDPTQAVPEKGRLELFDFDSAGGDVLGYGYTNFNKREGFHEIIRRHV